MVKDGEVVDMSELEISWFYYFLGVEYSEIKLCLS